jgi:hypothetical protein
MAIDGWVASGFEGVRDVFAKNFADGREVGAAFAAYSDGRGDSLINACYDALT